MDENVEIELDETEVREDNSYSFEETVEIGQAYINAYNSGVEFTMESPVVVIDTSDSKTGWSWSGLSIGVKIGAIGGSLLLIAGVVAAVLFLRRK